MSVPFKIKDISSQGALLVFEKPFALHGGIRTKEWWLSWERISRLIAIGLENDKEIAR